MVAHDVDPQSSNDITIECEMRFGLVANTIVRIVRRGDVNVSETCSQEVTSLTRKGICDGPSDGRLTGIYAAGDDCSDCGVRSHQRLTQGWISIPYE